MRTRTICDRASHSLPRSHDCSGLPAPYTGIQALCQVGQTSAARSRSWYKYFIFPLQTLFLKIILTLTCLECSTRLGGLWDPLHCTLRFGVSLLAGFAHLEVIIFDFHQQWLAILLLSSVCFRSFDRGPGEGVQFRFVLRIRFVCQSLVEVDRSRSLYVLR